MSKAFDRISWNFLITVLEKFGFNNSFQALIQNLFHSSHFTILINGHHTKAFKPKRGLKQGDPLSSLLFILASEAFSRTIKKETNSGALSPYYLGRNYTPITHLAFTDDLILFTKGDSPTVTSIKLLLSDYEDCSGWYHKLLSQSGRLTLIKHVLNTMPLHMLGCSKLTKSIIKCLHSKMNNFLWGHDKDNKKYHWSSWEKLCFPKDEGGLGSTDLNTLHLWNTSHGILTYLTNWWKQGALKKHNKALLNIIPGIITREIWKERNRRIYEEEEHTLTHTITIITKQIYEWIFIHHKGKTTLDIRIYDSLPSIRMGAITVHRWVFPATGVTLTTDAAIREGRSAGASILRTRHRQFLIAWTYPLQPNLPPAETEMEAAYEGVARVMEYQGAFEKLLTHVIDVLKPYVQSLFHAGLKKHLQHEISLLKPEMLSESFALARELEAKHQAIVHLVGLRSSSCCNNVNRNSPSRAVTETSVGSVTKQTPAGSGVKTSLEGRESSTTHLIRRLTRAERLEKDAKGLCYNYDQKWHKGHKCGRFILITGEEEGEEEDSEKEKEIEVAADISSLNNMAGVTTPRLLRLTGKIEQHGLDVLIDEGSTHNFVHPRMVEKHGLSLEAVAAFRVYVGNRDSLCCTQQCRNLALELKGTTFTVDLYVLQIHGHEVVLGVQWLRGLGRVLHDYERLTMEFAWGKQMAQEPKRLQLAWRDSTAVFDYGVITMRHMETYTGHTLKQWECGLKKGDEKVVNALRTTYCAAIVESDANDVKDKIRQLVKHSSG
ncbi:unnamed protein product [Cuscuta campestris]|uniref:Reverse transcriptase domain-containing protein n=1 Tax=Cuscuta campestris TaxID=132261 RepID=A0A484MY95_9ASTE|nr:unnamed protein product [Cuscuta campestris]